MRSIKFILKSTRGNVTAVLAAFIMLGATVDPAPVEETTDETASHIDSITDRISDLRSGFVEVEEYADSAVLMAEKHDIEPELAAKILKHARAKGLDARIAFNLVYVESRFHPRAVSWAGAMGLTQLMPATARWHRPGATDEEIFDVDFNLSVGFTHLAWLIERFDGDVRLALLSYNRGHGTVDKVLAAGGDPSNGYARAILR